MPPKKTKKILKQDQPHQAVSHQSQQPEAPSEEIFSESFRQRLDKYSGLTKEVLYIKADVEGSSASQELTDRRERVSQKIEDASSEILREELHSLEGWIGEQKEKLSLEIKRINKAYEENRSSLQATGSFSENEIKSQLSSIQRRAQEKQDIFDSYQALLLKSKRIYS